MDTKETKADTESGEVRWRTIADLAKIMKIDLRAADVFEDKDAATVKYVPTLMALAQMKQMTIPEYYDGAMETVLAVVQQSVNTNPLIPDNRKKAVMALSLPHIVKMIFPDVE